MSAPVRVLLIDNYDSFTHNLAHLFGMLGASVEVMRNDAPGLTASTVAAYDALFNWESHNWRF